MLKVTANLTIYLIMVWNYQNSNPKPKTGQNPHTLNSQNPKLTQNPNPEVQMFCIAFSIVTCVVKNRLLICVALSLKKHPYLHILDWPLYSNNQIRQKGVVLLGVIKR
jgi:hypothetical protein